MTHSRRTAFKVPREASPCCPAAHHKMALLSLWNLGKEQTWRIRFSLAGGRGLPLSLLTTVEGFRDEPEEEEYLASPRSF